MLEPEFKQKWVTALRSGKYKQGMKFLCNRDHYCCLGVAADLLGVLVNDSIHKEIKKAGTSSSYILHDLAPKGLCGPDGTAVQKQLADLNDNGYSFTEIANWIEANL